MGALSRDATGLELVVSTAFVLASGILGGVILLHLVNRRGHP
jgi:hypothetical protein